MQEGREIKPACFPRQSLEETLGTRVRLLTPVSTSTNRPRWRSGSLSRMCQHRQQWLVLSPITTYSAIVTQECLHCTTLSATVMQEHLKKQHKTTTKKLIMTYSATVMQGHTFTDYDFLSRSHARTSLITTYSAIVTQVHDFTDCDLLT